MVTLPIYLDNHSTTPVDPSVMEAMLPYFGTNFGNAASRTHVFGQKAAEAVSEARGQIAELIHADPREIVFTSGATESNNLAIKGVARMYRTRGNHIITAVTEHHAVIDPCKRLESEGFRVTWLPVDRFGRVGAARVAAALSDETILVSIMAANNEVGTLQPIEEIGGLCKSRDVLFHTDAVQAASTQALDVDRLGVDLLGLSAHKMYGPKGIGALYVRRRNPHVRLEPLFDGGGHERGMRSGTLPVPLIVGFGVACTLCRSRMDCDAHRLRGLRERLHAAILDRLPGVILNGHPTERLPGNLNLSFEDAKGEALLVAMRDVALSSGSACTSANPEPSYVLRALGVSDELAHNSLRFGIGRYNTTEEIDFAANYVAEAVRRLRDLNPTLENNR
jgi:cysteine desulfurase